MGEIQSKTSGAMIDWYTSQVTTPTHTAPSEDLAVFVGMAYGALGITQRRGVSFLDIGSGSGANTRYLLDEGYLCVAVDSSDDAFAHEHSPIEEYLKSCPAFDCIFDINTLCHVEDPPYEHICGALKPGGRFFSIHPADGTEVDMAGKGYTRIADILEMRRLLYRGFERGCIVSIHKCTRWRGETKVNYWQIRVDK